MAGPRQLISAPAFTSSPYGLLSVVQKPTLRGDPHWQNGVTWQSNCLSAALTYEECITVTGTGAPPAPPTLSADTDMITRGATPFTVYAKFNCSPVGAMDLQALAEDALTRTGSYQVERAFWTGQAASQAVVWPHLAASTQLLDASGYLLQSVPVTGAADDAAASLGYVEQQLADCYNGQGVIHIPRIAIPTFAATSLIKVVGDHLETLNGNLVAAGGGYPGTSPAGATAGAGTTWIYATGAVFMLRGPVRVTTDNEALNRAENTVEAIAEQTYVLGWSCCHAGAIVNIGVPTT